MSTGKTLFAQLMDFLSWSTFSRIVVRYDGDRAVPCLVPPSFASVMAFAQLTYRESLRDIEANHPGNGLFGSSYRRISNGLCC